MNPIEVTYVARLTDGKVGVQALYTPGAPAQGIGNPEVAREAEPPQIAIQALLCPSCGEQLPDSIADVIHPDVLQGIRTQGFAAGAEAVRTDADNARDAMAEALET